MIDKQQLAAMGEHMLEMEECKQQKHSTTQVIAWAGDYEKIGGHGLIVEMLKSYAGMLGSSKRKPEFKVPDGWRLVPAKMTDAMENAIYKELSTGSLYGFKGAYRAMIDAAPEYKP